MDTLSIALLLSVSTAVNSWCQGDNFQGQVVATDNDESHFDETPRHDASPLPSSEHSRGQLAQLPVVIGYLADYLRHVGHVLVRIVRCPSPTDRALQML